MQGQLAVSESILLGGVIHWASMVNNAPLCGSSPDEDMSNERDEVSCLVCEAMLQTAAGLVRRRK